MIYSCTMFYNEFDLLDLKIAEELDHVDKMIIVEGSRTFTNKIKNTCLRDNPKYKNKKIEIRITGSDFVPGDAWKNENTQRDTGIPYFLNDNDIVIACDIDEIITSSDFFKIIDAVKENGVVKIKMSLYYYYLNLQFDRDWLNFAFAATGKYLKEQARCSLNFVRSTIGGPIISTDGKHFSYLATPEKISEKIQGFSHTEYNKSEFTDIDKITERIKNKKDLFDRKGHNLRIVGIDLSYPKTILNNLDYWSKYILNDTNPSS